MDDNRHIFHLCKCKLIFLCFFFAKCVSWYIKRHLIQGKKIQLNSWDRVIDSMLEGDTNVVQYNFEGKQMREREQIQTCTKDQLMKTTWKKKRKKKRVLTQTCMLPHLSAGKDSMSHVMKVTSIVNFALPADLPRAHGSSSVFLACWSCTSKVLQSFLHCTEPKFES